MDNFFDGYSLGVEVIKHERGNFTPGGPGYSIHYKITNQTPKKIHILVQDEYVINENQGQFGKDYYLTGFLANNTSINAGAHRISGAVFLDSTCGGIKDKYKTGLSVVDETNGYKYDVFFVLDNGSWQLISGDVEEQVKKSNKKTIEARLKKSIERIDMFEEKLGVRLDNISIRTESGFNQLSVLGEVYSLSRGPLTQTVVVNVNLYNNDGEIIGTNKSYLSKDKFLGYDTFECSFYEEEIALLTEKIRVFVNLG